MIGKQQVYHSPSVYVGKLGSAAGAGARLIGKARQIPPALVQAAQLQKMLNQKVPGTY